LLKSLTQATTRLEALKTKSWNSSRFPVSADLLEDVHRALEVGLSDEKRAEIVRLLVGQIIVFTEITRDGKKKQRASVDYRFPV